MQEDRIERINLLIKLVFPHLSTSPTALTTAAMFRLVREGRDFILMRHTINIASLSLSLSIDCHLLYAMFERGDAV